MSTPIEEVVNITLSIQAILLDRAGFGLPLILSPDTREVDVVSEYSSGKAMTDVGYLGTDPAYVAASAMFAQNPRPPKVLVGRRTRLPTLRWAVTPVVKNNQKYTFEVNGTLVTITSDGSATMGEIIAALKTQIDALSLPITVSDQTSYMRIVENVAGAWHKMRSPNTKLLGITMDHADAGSGGVAGDATDIAAQRNDWYTVINLFNSKAEVVALAAWVESAKKLFIAGSQDSDIINTVLSGATDVAATLKGSAYARTAVLYSSYVGSFPDAAWAGRLLPDDAGSEQWALKTLAGIPVDTLDDTQYANAKAKNGNVYVTIAGVNVTMPKGTTASGEYIDNTRGSDAWKADLMENIFVALKAVEKQPMDDGGIRGVVAVIKASSGKFEKRKFLRAGQTTVTAPTADEVPDADRTARNLPNIVVNAKLAGAILSTDITVTITP